MIIPVRCPSTGKVVGHLWEEFQERVEDGEDAGEVLDDLGVEKYPTRTLFLTHVDLIDDVAAYKKV